MKKLPAFLNTPARVLIAVGALILMGEFLIMLLIESIHTTLLPDVFLGKLAFEFLDPIVLTAIVSPALYILVFKPMRAQQVELEVARKKIEQAHQEWMAALDAVNDPIFLHDKEFRILRCNKAYQRCAGIPFHEIIGQLYYEVFPKNHAPMSCCLRAMEKEEEEEEEEMAVGGSIYRSRSFSIHDEQGVHLYSIHILEDITESKQTQAAFRALVGDAAANVGAAFFHETVRSLSAWLGVECVIIGEIVDGNRVQALAMQLDGKAIEHYEYALPGTPCESATEKGYCEYHEGVIQLFPTDKDLVDMGAEAYVGIPVRNSNGKVNGILCAIARHKLALPPMTRGVFEIIAARAGTEIGRKQAEEKLRETRDYLENLFNHANAPIIVWNPSYRITMFNHAFEHLTGRDANEVIGKQIDILFPADRKDEALFHIYQTKAGERWETVEIPILHSSGEVRTALWNSATLYSADGKNVVATMAQGQDITERKRAEAQLAGQIEELRRWHDITLGRETRVLDLKHEVNELLGSAGSPPRYPCAEDDPQQK